MREMDFDEIVTVLETGYAAELGIGGSSGVILGKSQGEFGRIYAVLIGDETFMVPEADLLSTGRHVHEGETSSGESVKVQAERYPEEGTE